MQKVWNVVVVSETEPIALVTFSTKELVREWLVDQGYLLNEKQFDTAHAIFQNDFTIKPDNYTNIRICERTVVMNRSEWY